MENKKVSKKKVTIQAFKFLLFSCSAGLVQTGVFALLHDALKIFGQSYWPNYLIALICSVVWNFTLNRNFTFRSATNIPIAMMKIFLYYCIFTPASTWWGAALEKLRWNAYIILFLTMLVNLVTEFLVYKFIVFRKSEDTLKSKKLKRHDAVAKAVASEIQNESQGNTASVLTRQESSSLQSFKDSGE